MWKLLCKFSMKDFRVPHQRRGCSPSWSWSCESVHTREPSLQVWRCFQRADGPRWFEPESENKQGSCWKGVREQTGTGYTPAWYWPTAQWKLQTQVYGCHDGCRGASWSSRKSKYFAKLQFYCCRPALITNQTQVNWRSAESNKFFKKIKQFNEFYWKIFPPKKQVVVEFPCPLTWKSWGLFASRWRFCALLSCRRREAEGEGVPAAPLWSPSGDDPSPTSPPPHQRTNNRMKWSVLKSNL